jgi:SAM-dependent methyltransferase
VAFGAYRREVFDRAGLFDETFVRDADDEFHLRLTRGGGRIVLMPDIRVTYRCRDTLASLARQYAGYGFWKTRLLFKHGRLPTLRGFAPPALVAALTACLAVSIVTAEPRWFMAAALPYLFATALISLVIGALRRDPMPGLPFAFVTMHLAYGLGFWAGLVTPRRRDERDRIRRVFARRDASARGPEERAVLEERTRQVRGVLAEAGLLPDATSRVLDIGCGRGDSLATFDSRSCGVDLLPERVAAARTRHPGARLAVAGADELPFRDEAFHLCTLFTVMSSIEDERVRRDVAAEALRVLRPDGALVVYDFSFRPVARGVRRSELHRLFPGCEITTRRAAGTWRMPFHYVAMVRPRRASA